MRSAIHDGHERYFDCAFLARVSRPLIERATQDAPSDWAEIVDGAREAIASTLAPGHDIATAADKDSHVSLFSNTTAAFTRLLAQIERGYAGSRPTLLTTDLEYPGCIAAIDDAWGAPVVMAQLAAGLTLDPDGADAFLHDALVRAFNVVGPRVVLVSHVIRATGQVLAQETLRYFREANPCVLVIVDGSQAAGNVVVDAELLELCDFYISSGHKWLGGMATSGFVWERETGRWQVPDPAQSVAFRGQRQPGGAGNAAAWISLADSVADMVDGRPLGRLTEMSKENRRLARLFRERLAPLRPKVRFLTPSGAHGPPSGLVTMTVASPAGSTLAGALSSAGFGFSMLTREQIRWRGGLEDRYLLNAGSTYPLVDRAGGEYTETWSRRGFRFCFHYWHHEQDVISLTDAITAHLA